MSITRERIQDLIAAWDTSEKEAKEYGFSQNCVDECNDTATALRELIVLRTELLEVRKDAERYRWLRGPDSTIDSISKRTRISNQGATAITLLEAAELDAAIDAAMATQAGREGE